MTYLLDTDALTLAHMGNRGLPARIAAARAAGHEVAVSVVTRAEVLRGRFDAVLKAADGDSVRRMLERLLASESFLATFRLLTFDAEAADRFDQLRTDKAARKTDHNDLLQACVALANGATLVTRNTKDYAAVSNLKLENWAA